MRKIKGTLGDLMEYVKFLRILENVEHEQEDQKGVLFLACSGLLAYCKGRGYIEEIPHQLEEMEVEAINFGNLVTEIYAESLNYTALARPKEQAPKGKTAENTPEPLVDTLEAYVVETLKGLVLEQKLLSFTEFKGLSLYEFATFCHYLGVITKGKENKNLNTDGEHLNLLVENIAEDNLEADWWKNL